MSKADEGPLWLNLLVRPSIGHGSYRLEQNLMPCAGNALQLIEHIPSMVESNVGNLGFNACKWQLLRVKFVMIIPRPYEFLQLLARNDPDFSAQREFFLIWHHIIVEASELGVPEPPEAMF
jgi:hypothetical protein